VSGFRAELEVFNGPLDLLLHLVKHREVDITQVSLADITDRYLAAVRAMQFFDVNVAAEFLVVAATLMEIKSRNLLPAEEAVEEGDADDPGAELVRRLLEYKDFREAAGYLDERARRRGKKFARPPVAVEAEADQEAPAALLEDLATWDLMLAFADIMEQTSLRPTRHVVRADIPVSAYVDEVLAHMHRSRGPVAFQDFFIEECTRSRIVGVFLALLELVRRRLIRVERASRDPRDLRIALCSPARSGEPPEDS